MLDSARGGAGPEERGASKSVSQELGGALHHRRRLGNDALPFDVVSGGRRGAGDSEMEVKMGLRRQGRAGRYFFSFVSPVYRFGADL